MTDAVVVLLVIGGIMAVPSLLLAGFFLRFAFAWERGRRPGCILRVVAGSWLLAWAIWVIPALIEGPCPGC